MNDFMQNPVAVLNDIKNGLQYEVVQQTGPAHNRTFEVCVEIYGQKYCGIGFSKKEAKNKAATKALDSLNLNNSYKKLCKDTNETNDSRFEKNNPISILNDLKSNSQYNIIEQTGFSHNPTFKICLEVEGQTFYASGSSKQAAKYQAAREALKYFSQFSSSTSNLVENKKVKNINLEEKNPVSMLNGLKPGLVYKIIGQTGPPHAPIFKISVKMDDQKFFATENSKKAAKFKVAKKVLKYIQHIDSDPAAIENPALTSEIKTISDDDDIEEAINTNVNEKNPISMLSAIKTNIKYTFSKTGPSHSPLFTAGVEISGQIYYGKGKSIKSAKYEAATEALKYFQYSTIELSLNAKKNEKAEHILMLFNASFPGAKFICTLNENDPFARFKVTITVNNEIFTGLGSSKKQAQYAAATLALNKLTNFTPYLLRDSREDIPLIPKEGFDLAETVARLVKDKFNLLLKNDLLHIKKKVLAGIVMICNQDLANAKVICVTSGTQCISGKYINLSGSSLNDMHAEILSRRCLKHYFYNQLELLQSHQTQNESIFIAKEKTGFKLRAGIEFHLYISTVPCGDAAVFSYDEISSVDKHPNRISRSLLRTKIEAGEGTIPVKNHNSIQTWDAILLGTKLHTMSCSDKICKWNVLGMQGALLSYFIDPIYVKSIILGSSMNENHVYRAICGRIESTLEDLPSQFLLNKPTILPVISVETRQVQKPTMFSVIWVETMQKPEIVNTKTGKPEKGFSAVSKQCLAQKFVKLFGKISNVTGISNLPDTLIECKEAATSYNQAKYSLYRAFSNAGCGKWLSKPIEQDAFDLGPIISDLSTYSDH